MQWWKDVSSADELCFSLPLYPPGRPLVTADALPCFPVLDETVELLMYFLGCAANLVTVSLILWGGAGKRSQPTGAESVPRLLVLALCLTELSFLVFGETAWLVSFLVGKWTGGVPAYLYSIFVVVALNRFSKCIVVLMGIERYLSIKKPFLYDHQVTPRRIGWAMLAMIVYSLSLAGFFLAGVTTRTWQACPGPTTTSNPADCPPNDMVPSPNPQHNTSTNQTTVVLMFSTAEHAYEYFSTVESVLMTGILISCNVVVIRCMQKLKAHLEVACPRNRAEYVKQVDMIRGAPADFSRLMVAVAVVFVICILPYEIRWIANQLDAWHSPTLDYIAVRLYLSTSVINPLMYGIFRRKVRRKIKERTLKLIHHPCWCCCCKRKNRVRPQGTQSEQWRLPETVSGLVNSRET
ncbi:prostaglandin E2 receptor EP4 subtype-like [Patiria miniata]|uniref:G-protein coupled receptors family 1 profile domain-containing protein n=1 Tax=Patiria miniata TaxID=46514 RepID=A0A914BAR8_PATMI|nr:prostaglandin E2 receptor EP4 subtype-like [Patiria miniata]